MKKYSRVSYKTRCQIDAFLQVKLSVPEIAKRLGFHKSTIYREIRRNSVYSYYPSQAHNRYKERYKRCRRNYAVTKESADYILKGLQKGWSPEQISGRLRRELARAPSHTSIYRFIRQNKLGIYLRRFKKRGAGRYIQQKRLMKNGYSIHKRPQIANNRGRIGDWERDTMHTKNGVQLLVCTDRKSRYTKIARVDERTTKRVDILTKQIIEETGKKAKTITNDNGGDFKGKRAISERIYFCDPYKPQQRGTVENTIGLLRQYIKRKTDVSHIGDFALLEDKINLRPRKVLDYKTPFEVYYNKKVALAVLI